MLREQVDAELAVRAAEDAAAASKHFAEVVLVAFVSGAEREEANNGMSIHTRNVRTDYRLNRTLVHPLQLQHTPQKKRVVARRIQRWYVLHRQARAEAAKVARKKAAKVAAAEAKKNKKK